MKIRGLFDIGEMVDGDSEVALIATELRALKRKTYQRKLKLPDAIVAATAFLRSAILGARNIDDFKQLQAPRSTPLEPVWSASQKNDQIHTTRGARSPPPLPATVPETLATIRPPPQPARSPADCLLSRQGQQTQAAGAAAGDSTP